MKRLLLNILENALLLFSICIHLTHLLSIGILSQKISYSIPMVSSSWQILDGLITLMTIIEGSLIVVLQSIWLQK